MKIHTFALAALAAFAPLAGGVAPAAPSVPAARATALRSLPAALQHALYGALSRDAQRSLRFDAHGCATLPAQPLRACFDRAGAHLRGAGAMAVQLHLAGWGRGQLLQRVHTASPAITRNRVIYAHGAVSEWWRILPMGFEQGYTVTRRPAGNGPLVFTLATDGEPVAKDGTVAIGKLRYGKLVVSDVSGKVVPSTLASEDGRIRIAVDDAHADYPLTVDPLIWIEQKVTARDGVYYDDFGYSVALEGSTALISAPGADVGGAAYVLQKSGGTWNETAKLTASDGASGDRFGYSVAFNGSTALVGAPNATVGGNNNQGAVYVFKKSGDTWSEIAKLTANDGAADDWFGASVVLEGTTAIIGADLADIGGNQNQGAVYVFAGSGGSWSQTQKLTASDGATDDHFGQSAALDGTTALVGAWLADVGDNQNQGAVYVFAGSGGSWSQTQKLTASDGGAYYFFGYSVALDSTTALVGGWYGGNAAYVFSDSGGSWNQTQKFTASDGESFGFSVALDGATALVGAPWNGYAYQGAVYSYKKSGDTWSRTIKITASDSSADDDFGYWVALDGTTAIVGVPYADIGENTDQGAAYVYSKVCPQGYSEYDGTLTAGGIYGSPPYLAPTGLENGILGGPSGFHLYAQYSNGTSQYFYRIPGNEIHEQAPAGTYRWGVKAGTTGGGYVLCILHP